MINAHLSFIYHGRRPLPLFNVPKKGPTRWRDRFCDPVRPDHGGRHR